MTYIDDYSKRRVALQAAFQKAKSVSAAEVATLMYGLSPNRAGYISCPFHDDRTPSLKFFNDGRWHCFGCQRGGDSVSFIREMEGCGAVTALEKLDSAFNLGLSDMSNSMTTRERREIEQRTRDRQDEEDLKKWLEKAEKQINQYLWLRHETLKLNPDYWSEAMIASIQYGDELTYYSDLLSSPDICKQARVFRDRREILTICQTIDSRLTY